MTSELVLLLTAIRDVLAESTVRATRSGARGGYGQERVCLPEGVTRREVEGLVQQLDQVLAVAAPR